MLHQTAWELDDGPFEWAQEGDGFWQEDGVQRS
jgi:hypothetical protein